MNKMISLGALVAVGTSILLKDTAFAEDKPVFIKPQNILPVEFELKMKAFMDKLKENDVDLDNVRMYFTTIQLFLV